VPSAVEQASLCAKLIDEMGFDQATAQAALQRAGWNLDAAVGLLLG